MLDIALLAKCGCALPDGLCEETAALLGEAAGSSRENLAVQTVAAAAGPRYRPDRDEEERPAHHAESETTATPSIRSFTHACDHVFVHSFIHTCM